MVRTLLASIAMFGFALTLAGCSNSEGPRSDAPIKVGQGVDKKGNATKTMDLSLEDPSAKKKK
jgi:ABC-type uncharacterized transport system auxiliary subunit